MSWSPPAAARHGGQHPVGLIWGPELVRTAGESILKLVERADQAADPAEQAGAPGHPAMQPGRQAGEPFGEGQCPGSMVTEPRRVLAVMACGDAGLLVTSTWVLPSPAFVST